MSDRTINISGGDYNENIQGDNIKVQGDYIRGSVFNLSQDLSQTAIHIEQRLSQIRSEGYSASAAGQKLAQELAAEARSNPNMMKRLTDLCKFSGNAALSGLIGEGAVSVLKVTLALLGIPTG